MDAPIYRPAASFEQPIAAPFELSVENLSLAELMSSPATWEIVLKHAPGFKMMVSTPMIKPHLANFTVEGLSAFGGLVSREAIEAIDQDLRNLPRNAWPAL